MAEKMILTEEMSVLIRDARLSKGMTLAAVCEYVGEGLDLPTLSKIENHKRRYIKVDHVKKLEELFDLRFEDNHTIDSSLMWHIHRQRADILSLREENTRLKKFIYEQFGKQIGCCDGNGIPLTFTYSGDIDPGYVINMELDVVGRGD